MPDYRSRSFIVTVFLILLAAGIGFFAGQKYGEMSRNAKAPKDASNSLFANQEATIRGKITQRDNNTLIVKSDSGQSGKVKVSDQVIINRFDERARPATPSSDLRSIELNKDVTLLLNFVNGEYVVSTITYFPPLPPRRPPAPRSTPSPK
jgi:hypothetical protein